MCHLNHNNYNIWMFNIYLLSIFQFINYLLICQNSHNESRPHRSRNPSQSSQSWVNNQTHQSRNRQTTGQEIEIIEDQIDTGSQGEVWCFHRRTVESVQLQDLFESVWWGKEAWRPRLKSTQRLSLCQRVIDFRISY